MSKKTNLVEEHKNGKTFSLGQAGAIATALYLAILLSASLVNWSAFSDLGPNEWGDFLAGAFGPLALVWLVLGFFQQGRELQNSVTALQLQTTELQNSVEQQSAMAQTAREQFALDAEIRSEQIARSKLSDLPFFAVAKAIKFTSNGRLDSYTRYNFEIENFGADAVDIDYVISKTKDVKLRNQPGALARSAKAEFHVYLPHGYFIKEEATLNLEIKS